MFFATRLKRLKQKRVLSLVVAFVMVVSAVLPIAAFSEMPFLQNVVPFAGDIRWSLEDFDTVQNALPSTVFTGNELRPYMERQTPRVIVREHRGRNYLHVVDRASDWRGLDIQIGNMPTQQAGDYITIRGRVDGQPPAGSVVRLSSNVPGNVDSATLTYENQMFTIQVATTSSSGHVRLGSNNQGATMPFFVYDIIISSQRPDLSTLTFDPMSPSLECECSTTNPCGDYCECGDDCVCTSETCECRISRDPAIRLNAAYEAVRDFLSQFTATNETSADGILTAVRDNVLTGVFDNITATSTPSSLTINPAVVGTPGSITGAIALSIPNPGETPDPLTRNVAVNLTIPALSDVVIRWTLAEFPPIQNATAGTTVALNQQPLQQAGLAPVGIRSYSGRNYFHVTGRTSDWHSPQLNAVAGMQAGDWLTVRGRVTNQPQPNAQMAIIGTPVTYPVSEIYQVFTMQHQLTSSYAPGGGFRLGTNVAGARLSYFIYDIIISDVQPNLYFLPPPPPPPACECTTANPCAIFCTCGDCTCLEANCLCHLPTTDQAMAMLDEAESRIRAELLPYENEHLPSNANIAYVLALFNRNIADAGGRISITDDTLTMNQATDPATISGDVTLAVGNVRPPGTAVTRTINVHLEFEPLPADLNVRLESAMRTIIAFLSGYRADVDATSADILAVINRDALTAPMYFNITATEFNNFYVTLPYDDIEGQITGTIVISIPNPGGTPNPLTLEFGVVIALRPSVIFRMSTDDYIQALPRGVQGAGQYLGLFMQGAGPVTRTIVESPTGGNSIQLSGRNEDWHGLDVRIAPLNLQPDVFYRIHFAGRAESTPSGGFMRIAYPNNPWTVMAQTPIVSDWELSLYFTLDSWDDGTSAYVQDRIRLQTGPYNNHGAIHMTFIIDEIIVE